MARIRKIPPHILAAIKSGPVPQWRHWRHLKTGLSAGERVCLFIERFLPIPEGPKVGQRCDLADFQEIFILSIFDNPAKTRRAIQTVGRKNAKTALAANLLGAFMFMDDLCPRLSRINSGALSRDQAAQIYNYLSKSILMSPVLSPLARVTPSHKFIEAQNTGITYEALAADAGRAMGRSPPVLVLDELGQVVGPQHAFADALLTAQGAYNDPLAIIISTQAAGDADWLSLQIDDAIRNPSDDVVCHVYAAAPGCALDDETQWKASNPALGIFRSRPDLEHQAQQAKRLPAQENAFRNLILNQRVALVSAFLAPEPWKQCSRAPDLDVFRQHRVALALDLSVRHDLTAAVIAARDKAGDVHLLPFVFCPAQGIAERALRDRAPYEMWVKQGHLVPLGGAVMDYAQIAAWLRAKLMELGIEPDWCIFDRWAISHFKAAADQEGLAQLAQWVECGQGYKDMSPRCRSFEALILSGKIRHGAHPLLNAAAAAAIADLDASGNVKLAKNKSSSRIDALVAAVMASFAVSDGDLMGDFDPALLVG